MQITVNGRATEVADDATISRLLEQLGMRADRLALERNLKVVPRGEWSGTRLEPGDRIEIVQFVGGGCQAASPV